MNELDNAEVTQPIIAHDLMTGVTNVFQKEMKYILSKSDLYILEQKDNKLNVTLFFEIIAGAATGFTLQALVKLFLFMIEFNKSDIETKGKINPNFNINDFSLCVFSIILAVILYFLSKSLKEKAYNKSEKHRLIEKIKASL